MISFYNKHLGFNDTWLLLIGIPVVAVMMSLMMFGVENLMNPAQFFGYCIPMGLILTTIYWTCFRWIMILFRQRYPGVSQVRTRITYVVISILIAYVVLEFLVTPGVKALYSGAPPHPVNSIGFYGATLIVSFMIVAIYEGVYFYTLFQRTEMEKERLERANMESQLEGLRSHVNPHFLFNSLNTLSQLIREDSGKAERFVQKMSLVYRYILEMREKKLIALKEELQFLDSYLFLLHERFGDKVRVELKVEESAKRLNVIPLALQLLIENAIKHNVASVEKPLFIQVTSLPDKLVVRNSLQLKYIPMESTGFGLPNIRARYAYYTDREVDVITTNDHFMVTLPLLSVPVEEISTA